MQTVLVTGSSGFIGRHLMEALGRRPDVLGIGYDLGTPAAELDRGLREADVILHLAGVNRPPNPEEFQTGNAGLTAELCRRLLEFRPAPPPSGLGPDASARRPLFVLTSSVQAALENPYGVSKRDAENEVRGWAEAGGGRAIIFRLKNVFGKWCRPNYNSVTATFCYNLAHALPITISDPARELDLVYIDDVVAELLATLDEAKTPDCRNMPPGAGDGWCYREVPHSFKITLGDLAVQLRSFRDSRRTLLLPAFDDEFTRCLYATYLSYLDGPEFAYPLEQRSDARGTLAEFLKSPSFGQLFVSRTKPGVTRGNHYHHTKAEKFLVVEGDAVIRFRSIIPEVRNQKSGVSKPPTDLRSPQIIEHRISGRDFRVVDIPPGYTHSIENVGANELVVLFWSSQVFDPAKPDTIALSVL